MPSGPPTGLEGGQREGGQPAYLADHGRGILYGNVVTKVRLPANQRNACAIEAYLKLSGLTAFRAAVHLKTGKVCCGARGALQSIFSLDVFCL